MRRVRLLPGNTYSDFLKARPDRAEEKASLTLSELGSFLVEDIDKYHRRTHRSLGKAPLTAWEQFWSKTSEGPRLPKDVARFRLDFLPLQRRVIGRDGIELFGMKYSCAALSHEVDLGRKRVVRYDPRNLSRIYLEQPNSSPIAVPLRDPAMPTFSLWELKAIKRSEAPTRSLEEPEILRRVLAQAGREGSGIPQLKRNRRTARRQQWRSVELLADVAVPSTSLQATLTSNDVESLPWEVLE
jgi:putative transposase